MSKDVYIFETTEANFNEAVIQNSGKLPVVVLFMDASSELCFVVAEIFSKLAKDLAGQFIFAKVDIYEQPALRDKFNIKNVPTTLIIQDGNTTMTTEGQLTEDEARLMLKGINVFDEIDDMREQARSKHMNGETEGAIILLAEAIQKAPGNVKVALDMVQIFIDINQLDQAGGLFNKLPEAAKESDTGRSLAWQLKFIKLASEKQDIDTLTKILSKDESDMQARFDLAICLTAIHQIDKAIDHLLTIHKQDTSFHDGAAKELAITLIDMLKATHPEIASQAQKQLSNMTY